MEIIKKLVALSDGHGMTTYGKRTPILPNGLISETGNFMHENEFNRDVVNRLDKHLQRCGFDTLLVSPTDVDTPLITRTNLANSKKADIYVSVHANAFDAMFNDRDPQGIETFHYPNSIQGKKLAEIIHKHLIQGTKQVDRGVKSANFHELRETNMPSALIEADFMDNLDSAKLLLSDSFREECAREIAKGICEYFEVKYIETPIIVPTPAKLYRIRKSWEDAKSQIGAYANLETAKKLADTKTDYNVYDEQGNLVYPERKVIMQLVYKRVLRLGLKGEDVKDLQKALVELGYDPKGIDGSFGSGVDLAVRLLQKKCGLIIDGSVGLSTITTINQLLNGTIKSPSPIHSTTPKKSEITRYEILKPDRQTTIVKIPRINIDKIDVILAKSPTNTETVGNMQKRTGCDFIINGGLFWFNKGKANSLNLLIDESTQNYEGVYSKYGLMTYNDGSYKFGWYAWTNNLKDMLGGSPALIIDGLLKIDKGSMTGSLVTARHPRSAIGMDDKYFYLVTIDGRNPTKGLYGMTLNELAKYMLSLGCKFAINNDGGFSTRLMQNGIMLNKCPENRPVHNAIGVFLK